MNRLRKLLVGLAAAGTLTAATAAVLTTTSVSAQAVCDTADPLADCDTDGVPNRFEASGWWQASQEQNAYNSSEWMYPDFPTTCQQNNSDYRWKVLWLYRDTAAVKDLRSTVRNAVHAVDSAFAATSREVITSIGDLTSAHIPRWDVNANCEATITNVAVPGSVYDDAGKMSGVGALWSWLRNNGYNDPHVKYVSILQSSPVNGVEYGGVSPRPYTANDPGQDNAANGSTILTTLSWRQDANDWTYIARVMMHEMGHSIGATSPEMPHNNTSNEAHPSDCGDVMCYFDTSKGEVYDGTCGGSGPSSRDNGLYGERYDCHDDDYWNTAGAAWTTQRWNAYTSLFLNANIPSGSFQSGGGIINRYDVTVPDHSDPTPALPAP